MRFRSAATLLLLGLSACAWGGAGVRSAGAYDALRPKLTTAGSGPRIHLARAAYVRVYAGEPQGLELIYPQREGQAQRFTAGWSGLDAPLVGGAGGTVCRTGETRVYSTDRDFQQRMPGHLRWTNDRGVNLTCARELGTPLTAGLVRPVIVIASEVPWDDAALEAAFSSLTSVGTGDPMDEAEAVARALVRAAGEGVSAALVSLQRVR